ncbi:MAG: PAS domain-containing protein, partial [Myxococcota bacterium]
MDKDLEMPWLYSVRWLSQQVPGAQLVTDLNRGLLFVNDAYLRLLGRGSSEDLLRRDWTESVLPEERPALIEAWETAAREESGFVRKVHVLGRDEQLARPTRLEVSPLRSREGDQVGFLGSCTEISDAVAIEEKGREQRSLLELTDALLQVGHWRVHGHSGTLSWSDEVHRIHGTNPRTFQPRLEQGVDFYHPEDRELVARHVQEAIDEKKPFEFTARLVRVDGLIRTVRSVGTPLEVVRDGQPSLDIIGVFQDITEQAELLDRVATSEERYALAARASRDGIWDWDCRTDELFWTDRFREMLGLQASDLTGRLSDFTDRLHPEDLEPTLAAVQAHFDQRVPYDLEYRMQHASGRFLWIRAKGQASWDAEGRPLRMVGTVGDVTHEREQREVIESQRAALEKTTDELRKSNDELKNFASVASHDMRGPLRKIRWFVDAVLERNPGLDERSTRNLEKVAGSAQRLSSMVSELLDYATAPASAQTRTHVDSQAVAREVLELLSPEIEAKGATVHVGHLPPAHVNAPQLRQVMANLLDNALKYADPARPAEITLDAAPRGSEMVRFSVRDNGIGFD